MGNKTTFSQLREKAIQLETEINRHIVEVSKTCPKAAHAAEQASDYLAHPVVEWLLTAENWEKAKQ